MPCEEAERPMMLTVVHVMRQKLLVYVRDYNTSRKCSPWISRLYFPCEVMHNWLVSRDRLTLGVV